MRARVHNQQRGSGGSCAGLRVRARSGLQLEQAAGSTGEKKKEEASTEKKSLEKKLEERNKMDLKKYEKRKEGTRARHRRSRPGKRTRPTATRW
jgi:hypothetical protein